MNNFVLDTSIHELIVEGLSKKLKRYVNGLQTCCVCHNASNHYELIFEDIVGFAIQCCVCKFIGPYHTDPITATKLFNTVKCGLHQGF